MINLWNEDEQETGDLLLEYMQRVKEWGLDGNWEEFTTAIHTLQQFTWQHALQRQGMICGQWYSKLPRGYENETD